MEFHIYIFNNIYIYLMISCCGVALAVFHACWYWLLVLAVLAYAWCCKLVVVLALVLLPAAGAGFWCEQLVVRLVMLAWVSAGCWHLLFFLRCLFLAL